MGLRPSERHVYVFRTPTPEPVEIELVYVPAGQFKQGESAETAKIDTGFWIGRFPVTWRQFRAFEAATSRAPLDPPSWGERANHPASGVSWHDAMAFSGWAGVDL